jgi:hypothetical protein
VYQATSNSAPYNFALSSSVVGQGFHSLQVKAYDSSGNQGSSQSETVGISTTPSDTTAPTVSISSPSTGTSVSRNSVMTVTVSASDNTAVTQVQLYLDGKLVGTDTSGPYSFSWSLKGVSAGTHTITATAYDAAGNTSSASITIKVSKH